MQKFKFFVNKLPQTAMRVRGHFYLLAVLLYVCIHQGSTLCPPSPLEPGFPCYFIPLTPENWEDAKRYCLDSKATLAILRTKKNIMLGVKASYKDYQEVWIGGRSKGGKWEWEIEDMAKAAVADGLVSTSGLPITAAPSSGNNTNPPVGIADGLCLVLNADSEIASATCTDKKHFLCEYPICSPGCKEPKQNATNAGGSKTKRADPPDANATKPNAPTGGGELVETPTCDIIGQTMKCIDGCQEGYMGDECFLISRPKCSPNCKNCSDGLTCDGGCRKGYTGVDCELACRCSNPRNQSDTCPVMNICAAGCYAGFYGVACEKACSSGCGGDTSCDQTTAACSYGCTPPYTGLTCNNEEADAYELKTTVGMVKEDLSTTGTTGSQTPISEQLSSEDVFSFSRPEFLITTPLYSKSEPGDTKSREVLGFITIGSITGISIVVIFIVVVNVFYNKKNEKKPEEPVVEMAQQPEEEKVLEVLKSSTSV
ncbi:multiple epidermal growth factor-like domains protein 11 [Physella acuta]|uniref:multiple epidermal growth factor-like domains protein 11 n=1 Tax=Physella acuta TaxID=109671 RepID=UPI0027DAFAE6|nr:multiple epidermal growth factor-like domains protein 11 [Physella acuta]XP_059165202.1 multiple epidermal growth factor-like domains protein 11 [Physella acuta]